MLLSRFLRLTSHTICLRINWSLFWIFVKSESMEANHETVRGGYLNIFFLAFIYLFSKANLIFIYTYYTYIAFNRSFAVQKLSVCTVSETALLLAVVTVQSNDT